VLVQRFSSNDFIVCTSKWFYLYKIILQYICDVYCAFQNEESLSLITNWNSLCNLQDA